MNRDETFQSLWLGYSIASYCQPATAGLLLPASYCQPATASLLLPASYSQTSTASLLLLVCTGFLG